MLSWLLVGMYLRLFLLAIYLPLSLILLNGRKQYMEMLLGFVFMLFLSDSRQDSIHYFAADAKEIYILMLAVLLIVNTASFKPFNGFFSRYIPFFIVAIICMFNSPPENLYTCIERTTSYILLLFAVPNFVQRAHLDHGRNFYKALIYLCLTILLAGFIFRFIDPTLVIMEDRYQGLFGNPNGLGIFSLLFFFLLTVSLEMYPDLLEKREKMLIYAAIILSIIMSGSRGSLFSLIIFFVFSLIYKKSPFLGTIVAVIVIASYGYISEHLIQVINFFGLGDYFRVYTLEQGSGRFVAWDFSWKHIQESYWFGRGFQYTEYLFDIPENVIYLQALGHQGNAHNSYITLWLDTGLIGLITYVMALLASVFKATRKTRLAFPIIFAAIFSSFFESWLTASLNPFTIMLFITLSIISTDVIIPEKTAIAVPV